jgi:hypothetical protein
VTDVVERVLAAMNAQDLEAFLSCYTEDATIEDGYGRVAASGRKELRHRYGVMFDRYPDLRVEPGPRTDVGRFVVQEETVTGRSGHERHVAVYLVEDELIARERLFA